MTRFHNPDSVAAPEGGYSHGLEIAAGHRLLFISGQIPAWPDGSAPIRVTVEAGTSAGRDGHTEWRGAALCTVATHLPGSSPPSIQPDYRCDLWVEIGCCAQLPTPS